MSPRRLIIAIVWILGAMATLPAEASHIVGGEMTYICLGPDGPLNTRYRVRLDIYQDCYGGEPGAIRDDNPAFIGIFDGNNNRLFFGGRLYDEVYADSQVAVPPNFSNQCVNNAPRTCLDRLTFIAEYSLPNNGSGYKIVYQRCCRNSSIMNIAAPGTVGATYSCDIPPVNTVTCNSSAAFKNYPPQIICINNPLWYDHGATDPDGDSLSYEFCGAFVGGATDSAKPVPAPPPYRPVVYVGGFSAVRPMTGNPQIQIDPVSGIISGTPNQIGRFIVTVCCHEWRNGVIINTVTREFQFVVTNCSKAVVADIPQFSPDFNTYVVECKSRTVHFRNTSTGGFDYFWDFGVNNESMDTSSAFEPVFTYPDTGIYEVKLVVNKGSTCPDSISRLVKVFPVLNGDFEFDGLPCPKSLISFSDRSFSSYGQVNKWLWNFGDGKTSAEQHPSHAYDSGRIYNVVLVAQTTKGCTDSIRKEVDIANFRPFAGSDTIIVKGESIQFNARGGGQYAWSPGTFLNDSTIGNPLGYYPDTGNTRYVVYVRNDYNCEGYDTFNVWVVGQSAVFVPSAFSPNGDGLNDILKPIGIGYRGISFFRIYNRYGKEVYYSNTLLQGWDGNYKGSPAQVGTYYWVIRLTNRFGQDEMLKGDVTLVR